MRLAMGILMLGMGAIFVWFARADIQDTTPWGAYRTLIRRLQGA